ncbi:MAG: universal stress protein [Corynebacteriales bacterium]|nr:universal stress protein [Mycobacteriales bacterium]
MRTSGEIVVGVDGSEHSDNAVEWAAKEAAVRKVSLVVAHAWVWPLLNVPLTPSKWSSPEGGLANEANRVLEEAEERARKVVPALTVTRELLVGSPAGVLLELSKKAGLVVVGHRGLGGFTGLLVGSTGVQLSAHSACPVAVVRPDHEPADIRRIVVGVDDSAGANSALDFALKEAEIRDAELDVVHVWHASEFSRRDYDTNAEIAEQNLNEILATPRQEHPDVDVRAITAQGRPKVLLEYCEGAELLVVGARGRGGFKGLTLGSTSQTALHHAACPVVIVRSAESGLPAHRWAAAIW